MIEKRNIQLLFCFLVFLMLAIPSLGFIFKIKESTLWKSKELSFSAFPQEFDNCFKNEFTGRAELFWLNSKLKSKLLQQSSKELKAIVGEDGWLFLGNSDGDALYESLGYKNLNPTEIEKIVAKIKSYQDWCSRNEIEFYFAIAPSKHSIYSEYLPYRKSDRPTSREQLIRAFRTNDMDYCLDLSDSILKNKHKERLYMKTDTHWNDAGAYHASNQLLQTMQIKHPIIPRFIEEAFQKDSSTSFEQDLSRMLLLKQKEVNEEWTLAESCGTKVEKQLGNIRPNRSKQGKYEKRYKCIDADLKLLMFRDSFGSAMIPFLAESFGSSVYIWHSLFDKDLIEHEKPDIVVLEVVERYVDNLAK